MIRFSRFLAFLGGIVLALLIVLTCLSIVGRMLNGAFHSQFMQSLAPGISNWLIEIGIGPINGDFELVEAGVAFAIFAFLPLCQVTAGHAFVDILTNLFPKGVNRFLKAVIEITFALVLILIAWRLYEGTISKMKYGETTFLLQFPIWWAYLASLIASISAAVVSTYVGCVRVYEFWTRKVVLSDGLESDI